MSKQDSDVETDPKKISILDATIETAILKFERAFKQFAEEDNPRIKNNMRVQMNRFVLNAIRYAMQGDTSVPTAPYPKWIIQNQAQLQKWLENPHIGDEVKNKIREATRKAMGQPEPEIQRTLQAQSNVKDLSNALASARDMNEFISIIENYPNDIYSKNGHLLNKEVMLQQIHSIVNDPGSLKMLALPNLPMLLFAGTNITSNYGMQDKFLQLAKKEYQNNIEFPAALSAAKSINELIAIISNHPNELVSSDGKILDKNTMLAKIKELSINKDIVELIAGDNVPLFIFAGANITRQYGMRDKFIELVKKQHNEEIIRQFDHLKPEVIAQVTDMFEHFGTHYILDNKSEVHISFSLIHMTPENCKAFESILEKSNIPFNNNGAYLVILISPDKYSPAIAALKTAAHEIDNSQINLQQRIKEARSLGEIIRVIKEHDGLMLSSSGMMIPKEMQLRAIENLINPDPDFRYKVTRNYGLEEKVITLVQEQREMKANENNEPLSKAELEPEFAEFLDRLDSAKWRPTGEKLDKRLNKNALVQTFDFFLSFRDSNLQKNLSKTQKIVMNENMANIAQLKPGEAFRLDKQVSGLPRTIMVMRSDDGEFKLIVETKSKLADDSKLKLDRVGGTFKSGKAAWRIDSGEIEHFNLVTIFNEPEYVNQDLAKLEKEVDISKQMASEHINRNQLGVLYKGKDGEDKVSVYSVRAAGTLEKVTDLGENYKISSNDKDALILELLKGVQKLHENGLVHQDLKPPNILVFGNPEAGYHLKLTDFGLTKNEGENTQSLATSGYQSPEIAFSNSTWRQDNAFNYFQSQHARNALGDIAFRSNPHIYTSGFEHNDFMRRPNKANDMWAIGIIAFEIRYGRAPTLGDQYLILRDPLLKGLLDANRVTRLKVSDAIALQEHKMALYNAPLPSVPIQANQQGVQPPLPTLPRQQPRVIVLPTLGQHRAEAQPQTQDQDNRRPSPILGHQRTGASHQDQSSNLQPNIDITIINKTAEIMLREYNTLRAGKGALGWAKEQAKNAGRSIGDKGVERKRQINDLANAFKKIDSQPSFPIDKAIKAYSYLMVLSQNLNKSGVFTSALQKLCEQYIRDIKKNPDVQKAVMSMSFDEMKAKAASIDPKIVSAVNSKPKRPKPD